MPQSNRPQRVAELIQHTLAMLLLRGAKDPRFAAVTITSVDVSPDLANATIYISMLEEQKIPETLTALNNAAGYFRHQLADAVELRITPKLIFRYDDSISRADRISRLLDEKVENNKIKKSRSKSKKNPS